MNLIQQAVERAVQLEQQGIRVTPPLPTVFQPGPAQPLTLQPQRRRGFVPMLAVALLAIGALGGGALLYVLLVKTQSLGAATASAVPAPPEPTAMAAPAPSAPLPSLAAQAPPASAAAAASAIAISAEPVPAPPPAPLATDEARQLVERWARAWSERDVTTYLGLYGEGFAPGKGLSRQAWEKSRRQMIERRSNIQVTVNDLQVDAVSEDQVTARFKQDYAADKYRESAIPKRLVLVREASGWRIVSEASDTAKSGAP